MYMSILCMHIYIYIYKNIYTICTQHFHMNLFMVFPFSLFVISTLDLICRMKTCESGRIWHRTFVMVLYLMKNEEKYNHGN